MFKKQKLVTTNLGCYDEHPEHQERDTRVSEYLRKYGQGKIDDFPTDRRAEVTDERSVDEMLDGDSAADHLSVDELDILAEFERKKADFEAMEAEISQNEKDQAAFKDAVTILNSASSSTAEKREALEVLDELMKKGKVTKTRARAKT